ncbi:MAG: HAMP domain-containing sensor histidine kinase [Rickettsiales bacterium]|nr:HAMP domain-containing sensor histidine kinase [Rickettsiales bacterium]
MALLFTVLLGVSAAILGYFLYDFGKKEVVGESYARFQQLSILIMVLMSLVVLVSFVISSFVVSRINTIASTAREIMDTGDLSRRISIDTNWDDLSNLAQVLNGFLARVESLMDGIREVSNNIAHDLRTPLTHLRNQIEELKTKPVTDSDIDALLTESDRILAIFHSLLRIANIEKTKRHQAFEDVNLATLLQDVAELYEPVAEEKSIHLMLQQQDRQIIKGDRHLLFQLFANVFSNAIKFSPVGGEVSVRIDADKNGVGVLIDDRGPGISTSEKEAVFRRFYRGDASRSTEGNGLGLSLVKAIVDLHQGSIVLEDNNPGLRVRVTLQSYQ